MTYKEYKKYKERCETTVVGVNSFKMYTQMFSQVKYLKSVRFLSKKKNLHGSAPATGTGPFNWLSLIVLLAVAKNFTMLIPIMHIYEYPVLRRISPPLLVRNGKTQIRFSLNGPRGPSKKSHFSSGRGKNRPF